MATRKTRVGTVDEFEEEDPSIIVEVDGMEIAVFCVDDEYYALANYCVHQSGPLCEGELTGEMCGGDDGWEWKYGNDGKIIKCPWHSWKFNIETGENIKDNKYRTPTYDVEVSDGNVYVLR